PKGAPLTLPAEALEVFDVSGAGDTVVAAVATYLCAGLPLEEAARIANVAAAIEVAHVGAKAVSREEILARLGEGEETDTGKVMTAARAAAFVARKKGKGETVVFTNGCFDLLHAGHVDYLQKARAMGDALIVGLNSDRSVRRLKGSRRPLVPQGDRAEVLAALACVDGVVLFDDETPAKLIARLIPSVLVKGGDYSRDTVVGADTVEKNGGQVKIVPLKKGRSSSSLIDLILQRYQP
ncbi:MAG: D-glycero-beta-D-manno-heptose 1-phosphate adenylyltransferase, partial [Nitrospinae bacterium]|nr:D-glycero-beta-D-manno-heptose 1-phosphate adenylyltransferase [Nitrospinota bacterium]